jgi:hypothetical protein
MKTTLDLDEELLYKAKSHAARERTSLTALIEEGLRLRLRTRIKSANGPVKLPLFRSKGGLLPGIDPNSNRSMLDAADTEE